MISMLGEGESRRDASFFYERILLPTYLRGAARDKRATEKEVRQSNLDWVILRPAALKDEPASGVFKITALRPARLLCQLRAPTSPRSCFSN